MRPGPRRAARFGAVAIAAVVALVLAPQALANTFTVTTTADDTGSPPVGSLRWAIEQSNANVGIEDTIDFDLPPLDSTIVFAGGMPAITDPVVIDGTIPGATYGSQHPRIDGTGLAETSGLVFNTQSIVQSVVRGLSVTDFDTAGLQLNLASVLVAGNFIGVDPTGTVGFGNQFGITAFGAAVIGGSTAADRNVISGNVNGINLGGSGTTVQGNYIGTNAAGTAAIPNNDGIFINNGADETIGGSNSGEGNLISGNSSEGLRIEPGTGVVVYGNLIGTQADGSSPLGNGSTGVGIGQSNIDNNVIGGTSTGEANTIAFNATGVGVGGSGRGDAIRGNSIFSNTGLGIDLSPGGVNANDPNDADTGPNEGQNFPDLATATALSGGHVEVTGTVTGSLSGSFYTVDVYASSACDPSGHGEGERYLGSVSTQLGTFDTGTSLAGTLSVGEYVTATATDTFGDTSEFSSCVQVAAPPGVTYTVNSTSDVAGGSCTPSLCTLRDAIDAADAHPGPDVIAFALPGGGQQTITLDAQRPALSVTEQVTIDGTTEPNIAPSSVGVTIDGGASGGNASSPGLVLAAGSDGSTVKGLAFVNFQSEGFSSALELVSSGDDVVGNYFGVAADASTTSATQLGILITGDGNTVGGIAPSDRNVFVSQTGVYVGDPYGAGVTPSGNDVLGNTFGLLPDGITPGTSSQGIYLTDGAYDNVVGASLVGGGPTGAGNIFAGQTGQGVWIAQAGAGNAVGGNTFGLDAEGAPVLPGMQTGVEVTGTTGTIVGENVGPDGLYGLHSALGNVIAGTASEAIFIGDDVASSTGTIVAGNFIGVDRSGAATSPNATGISVVDSSGNQLGPGNTIANSTGDGIALRNLGTAPVGNRIVANSIYANGGAGIALGDGGNNGLPAPTVTSASTTSASGMATGPAGSTLFVEVFGNPSCDGAANGAGQTYGTYTSVTLPTGQGNTTAAWTAGFASLPSGAGVTATATNSATNDTSTFSTCTTVGAVGSGGSVSGSVAQTVDDHIDLTAAGTEDWALWGYDQGSISLAPDVRKANGFGISALSATHVDDGPPRNFGQFAYPLVPFGFDWSDGSPTGSASGASAGITAPQPGQGFTFTVPADTTTRTLTVWTSAHYADGTLTASLSDHSAADYVATVHATAGQFTDNGENVPEVFTIQYAAASSEQHLTVRWTQDTNNGCDGCDDVVIYAAALASSTATGATATLTSAPSVGISGSNDLLSDIPLRAFETPQSGTTPAPINGLPINGLPINGLPINGLPINGLPINGLPINGLPINGLPINGLPINGLPINGLPLSDLPINGLAVPGGWEALLAGTPLAGKPLQTITLQDVLSLPTPPSITLGELDLSTSALGRMTIGALALGSTPINGLGSEASTIESDLQAWCRHVAPTADCSAASIGTASLFALGLAGAPINGLPINGLPINGLPINGLPINGLPINGLDLSASPINGLPINGLPINGLPLGTLPINGLPALGDVCTDPTCGGATTLAEAQANGAIKPGATLGDLRFYDDLTIGDLEQSLDGPDSTVTLGDLIGLLIKRADVPWETLPPRLLSAFDPNRSTLALTAGFTLQGPASGQSPAIVAVTLPDGFDYVPGSAGAFGDPAVSGGTLTWNVPNVPFGTPQALSFDVWSGTSVGPTQATERVTAGSAADSSTAAFDVTDSFEPNDTVGQATTITPDQNVELSAIGSRGDVDYYKVPMPPAGTRLQVHLTNLTADYDLALYAGQTTSVRTGTAGNVPLQDGAVPDQSLNLQGGVNPQLTPTALQDVPDPGIPAVQVSANRGTDDEDVGMVSPGGGGYAYIAVFGYNGASSPDPYTLRVTTKAPQTVSCPARTFGFAGQGTAGTVPSLASLPANLNTLILVNEKRIGDTYGSSEEANVVSSLTRLAGDNGLGVSGAVIPVGGLAQSEYDAWDANPCDSGAANAVANAIADEIDQVKAARSGLEYVVFVGGDDQIPFFRLPDLSYIANETGFAGQFGQNEYYGALAGGNLLSDNPYLDTRPVPASGRQLFIPDLVGGRLVETPDEITGAIQRFEDAGGALDASSAFVSGYDFVSDGSELVRQRLEASLPAGSVGSLIDDTWSKDDLLAAAFPAGGPAAINDWNGHYDNYQALAANGDQSNLLSTSTLTGAYALSGGIFFTMGCHAGFQTTDAIVGATAPDKLDWAEYFAGTGTGFVGNTGFGLGNTDSVAFSEELMADLAGHLDGTASIGQALEAAKRDYYLSRLAFSSYDEKTLSEAELYGLPMYGVGSAPAPVAAAAQPAAAQPAAAPPDPVTGTMSSTSPSEGSLSPFFGSAQTAGFDAVPDFSPRQTGAHGDYYTNAGQVQAPNYRPLQPYVTLPATRSGLTAHGVVVDALTSRDDSPFNPDNVRPTLDLSAHEPEPQFADEAWPTKVPTLVSLDDGLGLDQELNLATGQFFTDTGGSTPAGVERLWTHIGGRVTYSTSPDFVPPTIDQIDAFLTNGTVAFTGRFSDRTETGAAGTVVFAQVVYDVDSSGTWQAVQLQRDPSTGAWSGGAPFTGAHVQFFVEACDLAGNCGYSSNKGRYFDAAPLPAPTGSITITPSGPAGSGAWFTGPVNVDIASATGADVTVSVDGAPFVPLSSPLTLSGDGSHTIDARGSDGSEAFAVVLIDGTPPDVDLTLPPTAGIGEHVAVAFACTDRGSGVTSCTATQNGSPVSNGGSLDTSHAGTVQVVVSTEDAAGNAKQVTKSVVIEKATPTITWPAPAPIAYGTKLGPAQLDATASVPGTFVYDPPAGTVLQPGVQTLSVTFTPANTADYTTATATVHITVGFTRPCITTRRTGPFKVEEGTSICVSGGASITGPITIEKGGALWVGGATLTGPYKATKAAALTLCNTRVTGPITVSNSTGYVLVGGVAATGCAGNTITGPVKITNGSGGLSFARNHVTGPVTITGNHGGFIFTGNTITGPVHVSGNS